MSIQFLSKTSVAFRQGLQTKTELSSSMPSRFALHSKQQSLKPKSLASHVQNSIPLIKKTTPVLGNLTFYRAYSGRENRRAQRQQARVQEHEEHTYVSDVVPVKDQQPLRHEEETRQYQQAPETYDFDPNATTEELILEITPAVLQHLRKVYTTLGIAAGVAALGGVGAMSVGIGSGLAMVMGIGSIAPLLGALLMDSSKVLLRQNLLFAGALMCGLGIGPLLGAVSLPSILLALAGTGGIFAGFSLAALKAKSTTFLKYGGLMFGGVIVLLGAALLGAFGGALGLPVAVIAALKSVNLYGGLLLMSLFVAWDTQSMIARAAAGQTDHVSDAVNMFIDVWGIFVRLLAIFGQDD